MEAHGEPCCLEPLDSVRFPWLFLGDRRVARNEQLLRRQKIAYIINCTPPCGEGGVPNFHERLSVGSRLAFRYLRVPVFDTHAETLQPHFENVWELMETCRTREDGNLLIHCSQGVSRSVAFICSYLIKYEGMSFDEALAFVRRRNPLAQPNESFRSQLETLHECVKKESRLVHSEPRRLPQSGWLPPFAATRKRVISCSMPNGRPQRKVARLIGPSRPPATDGTPPSSASEGGQPNRETNTPSSSSASSPSVNSCKQDSTRTGAERVVLVDDEPSQEALKHDEQLYGEATAVVDEERDRKDSSNRACEFTVHSLPDVDGNDAIPRPSSDNCCDRPVGCKDTPLHRDPRAVDSVVSSPRAEFEQRPEHLACAQEASDDSEAVLEKNSGVPVVVGHSIAATQQVTEVQDRVDSENLLRGSGAQERVRSSQLEAATVC